MDPVTVLELPARPAVAPALTPSLQVPTVRGILQHSGSSLLQATIVPTLLFYVGWFTYGKVAAYVSAMAWALGVLAVRKHKGQRVPGLLVLSFLALTGRTVSAVATGSTYIYFIQPIIWTALVGLGFLVSAATARPLIAKIAGDFYPLEDAVTCRAGIKRLFRRLTVMWGCVNLLNAAITFWLLETMSTTAFVGAKAVSAALVTWSAIGVTIVWSVAVARSEGLLPKREPRRGEQVEVIDVVPALAA